MQEYVTSKIRVHYFLRIDVHVAFSPMLLSCGFSFSLLGNPTATAMPTPKRGTAEIVQRPLGILSVKVATGPGSDVSSN